MYLTVYNYSFSGVKLFSIYCSIFIWHMEWIIYARNEKWLLALTPEPSVFYNHFKLTWTESSSELFLLACCSPSLNFSHFHLLLLNNLASFNQTWHKAFLAFVQIKAMPLKGDTCNNIISSNNTTKILKIFFSRTAGQRISALTLNYAAFHQTASSE